MKSQVLSIEQMQTLKDKGFDISVGSMMWVCHYETLTLKDHAELMLRDDIIEQCKECMPTMTLQDILKILPKEISDFSYDNSVISGLSIKCHPAGDYTLQYRHFKRVRSKGFLNTAYIMLLWCIDNGHIEVKPQQLLSDSQQKFIMNKFTKVE